jgi:hypothetical protein
MTSTALRYKATLCLQQRSFALGLELVSPILKKFNKLVGNSEFFAGRLCLVTYTS